MTDRELQIEAMMHLEYIDADTTRCEMHDRVWAAHYLIQAMFDGCKPDNFDGIVEAGRKWSAVEAIH